MGRPTFVLPLALALLAAGSNRAAAQQAAPAGGGHPFDGQWSLTFSAATAPGGVSAGFVSPYNSLYKVENRRFEVRPDGSFDWLASETGTLHTDGVSPGGSSSFKNDFQLHLRGKGKVDPPPEDASGGESGNRRLSVKKLSLLSGSGLGSAINNGATTSFSVGVVSADLSRMTYTSYPGGNVTTVTNKPLEVTWENLRSTRVTRDEIAPDVVVETALYKASRQGTWPVGVNQVVPVTEEIEVKHVRYLKLVPRG